METLTPELVERMVRSLVAAEKTKVGIEVSTPIAYPDGDLINVIVEQKAEGILVHDSGFAAARLSLAGITLSRHVAARLAEYAGRFNCHFENRRVTARAEIESLELAVAMVANASRSVADYALEIRKHAETDFRAAVTDAIREITGDRFHENEEFQGRSGRKYRLSTIVLDRPEIQPAVFIAPIANRTAVSHGFAMLYDLKQNYISVDCEAIYDETSDLRDEDRALLGSAAEVHTLSQARLRFRQLIGAPLGNA